MDCPTPLPEHSAWGQPREQRPGNGNDQSVGADREDLYRMTPREKKSYLLALVTIANSDDNIAKEELDLIKSRAKKLKYRVKESDLKSYDIQKIAEEIRKPNVRTSLFEDLLLIAKADRNWDLEELKIIRYFSRVWEQPLPDIPSMKLTWEKVGLPTEIQVEKTSIWKRKALEKPRNKKIIRSADPGIRWGCNCCHQVRGAAQ